MLTHTPASHPEVTADTPCTGHCSTALGDDVCRSCLRTFDEITRWVEMDEAERRAVNLRIADLAKTPPSLPLSGEVQFCAPLNRVEL